MIFPTLPLKTILLVHICLDDLGESVGLAIPPGGRSGSGAGQNNR